MALGLVAVWLLVAAGLWGALMPPRRAAPRTVRLTATSAVIAGGVALTRLSIGFATNDWSSVYVADHSRSGLSPLLRMAGLWAGPEGSLLLFTVGVAAAWLVAVGIDARPAATARIGAGLTAGFALLVALFASPFDRLPTPAVDGLGLQPILEHPAMVWHPPLLYSGLVGLLVPALLAVGRHEGRPVGVPPASLAIPLALLTGGLLSGARWAHAELGWGGYWAWDPIESAGLVAWLAAAAALHAIGSSTGPLSAPARLLAVLPGIAAIWATTLTRIGVVDSVHAFADRPALRVGLLILAAGASGALLGTLTPNGRFGRLAPTRHRRRATGLLLAAAGLVALGTYEPLIEAAIGGDAVAIAGVYFSRVLWPLVIVGSLAVLIADRKRGAPVVGALVAVALTPFGAGPFGLAVGAAGGATAASALAVDRRGRLAHIGVGVLLVGVAGTMASTVERATLPRSAAIEIAGMEVEHLGLRLEEDATTSSAVARIRVDGRVLEPRLVRHDLRGVSTAEVAHTNSLAAETQVILLDGSDGAATYRIIRHPRILFVWLGGLVLVLGCLGSVQSGRRRRLRANSSSTVERSDSPPESVPATGGVVGGGAEGSSGAAT